ncbi:hypothetical protein ACI65C_005023 [Semiaphis heraclei]
MSLNKNTVSRSTKRRRFLEDLEMVDYLYDNDKNVECELQPSTSCNSNLANENINLSVSNSNNPFTDINLPCNPILGDRLSIDSLNLADNGFENMLFSSDSDSDSDIDINNHLKISDSLFKARKMVKKGLKNIDISSTDDDILLKPKQKTAKTASNLQFSSSCPTFSASEDDNSSSDENIKKNGTSRTLLNGWSPSPKKVKLYEGLKNPPTSLTNDSYINASKSSTVKKLSFSDDNNTSLNGTFKYKNIVDQTNLGCDLIDINSVDNYVFETPGNLRYNNVIKSTDLELDKENSDVIVISGTPQYTIIDPLPSTKTPENVVSTPKNTTEFEKEVLHRLTFLKFELKRAVNNQREMVQRLEMIEGRLENIPSHDVSTFNNNNNGDQSSLIDKDFNIPLDNIIDLEIFEDKISDNKEFRNKLVAVL